MRNLRIALLVVIFGLLGVRQGVFSGISLPSSSSVEAPSEELQEIVSTFRQKVSGTEKAAELSRFYAAWADVIERDKGATIPNTLVFERAHRNALVLYGFTDGPIVGSEIDAAIAAHLGVKHDEDGYEPVAVDYTALTEVLRALSWAASQ